MKEKQVAVVIGGGAAGFFGAITCAQHDPNRRVILLEKNKQVLSKVRISGGGRCNVTHACFDPQELIKFYPRGGKELRGAFSRFQPKDTIGWFESRGVPLKAEDDGRMFPVSDSSESIISCLQRQAKACGVELWIEKGVIGCQKQGKGFRVELSDGQTIECDHLLFACGSSPKAYTLLETLGHRIIPPVPSLFTFNVPNSPLVPLAGISVSSAKLKIEGFAMEQQGPLLITHWGFSGPAVLKLSAWGARFLHEKNYKAVLHVDWLPDLSLEKIQEALSGYRQSHPSRLVSSEAPFSLPKNLWKALLEIATIPADLRWAAFSKQHLQKVSKTLHASTFQIDGKSTYKEEFVTCGGIDLKEVDFKTMESKVCSGLYFAGEILDIDGITGGFNFQAAWTTSWIAGKAIAAH